MPSKRRWKAPWKFRCGAWRWGPVFMVAVLSKYPDRPKWDCGWERNGYLDDGPWFNIDLSLLLIQVGWSTNRNAAQVPNEEAPF